MSIIETLSSAGFTPNIHILDNESSTLLKTALKKKDIKYQLVPPHIHCSNAAERAIQTFKAHLISGLCSTHLKFPAAEWDRLLPQCEITLNLLRASRINPKVLAYNSIFGIYNFNKTPLAPPGTQVVVHEKVNNRKTWALRGTDGWYVGPATEHYR